MKRLFITLEDGAVFEGRSVNGALDAAGLLSFYTGVVGYQEVVTDPSNLGKIVLFTYPMIGNYGVNPQDAESASITVKGLVTKEYPSYYSNFRATGNLADYLGSQAAFGTSFDTRAILLHLRDHGEMLAAMSGEPLKAEVVRERAGGQVAEERSSGSAPVACAQARPIVRASVVDLGASRSFYKHLAALGVDACCDPEDADLVIVSDAPHYLVESSSAIERVKSAVKGRPAVGFGHGSAILAQACGGKVKRLSFGDHGVNVPVAYVGGGRNEITVQNHNFVVVVGDGVETLFTNVHDGTCEGFKLSSAPVAGANFVPAADWFGVMLRSVGVK
jgi:carbamoyl-phosphate synthase small subunit